MVCSRFENDLRDGRISKAVFEQCSAKHLLVCPATFSDLASVHLDSAIAPQVVLDAKKRGIIFKALVTDGDNKTHEILKDVYNGEEEEISRYECLSHVLKRLKANLCKAQDKLLKDTRAEKAFELKKTEV